MGFGGNQKMPSYFVARDADGAHAVHDRSRCPPNCFPLETAAEYLGEFLEAGQAMAVARLCYRHARRCVHTELPMPLRLPPSKPFALELTPLRP
jgi:hypothetical protein